MSLGAQWKAEGILTRRYGSNAFTLMPMELSIVCVPHVSSYVHLFLSLCAVDCKLITKICVK